MELPNKPDNAREPLIIEDDPLTDELTRQADELDLIHKTDDLADFSQHFAEQLGEDHSFPQSHVASEDTLGEFDEAQIASEQTLGESDQAQIASGQTQDASEPDTLPAAAAIAATSALTVAAPDLSSPRKRDNVSATGSEQEDPGVDHTFPLDLSLAERVNYSLFTVVINRAKP